jgi:6-phosphogluconolactonase
MDKNNINLLKMKSKSEAILFLSSKILSVLKGDPGENKNIVLTGGNTCRDLYKTLAKEHRGWRNVNIFLTDERCVKESDENSNAGLLRRLISEEVNQPPEISSYFDSSANNISENIASLNSQSTIRDFQSSVTLLGLGEDGHIASLFPGSLNLNFALDLNTTDPFWGIHSETGSPDRISLTLNYLLKTDIIYLLTTGGERLKLLENSIRSKSNVLPIDFLLHQKEVAVQLIWYP